MKIGDYIRTDYGSIVKIEAIDEEVTLSDKGYIDKESVFKSSPDIIDLIEENDIVNYSRVVCIAVSTDLSGTHKYLVLENRSNCANGNIKSIVTKEQFESMEYRIGE